MIENSPTITETQHPTNALKKDTTGFVPSREELIHLLKYWVKRAIADEYFIFWGQCVCDSDVREIRFDWARVNEIGQILGDGKTDGAVREAYEEAAQEGDQDDWIVFRYGTTDEWAEYQAKGGQFLSDFECGASSKIACKVVERVLREGTPEQQQALVRDELARYAKKLHSYKRGWRDVAKIFGIFFPIEVGRLVPITEVDDTDPQANGFGGISKIDQGKVFLAKLDEIAKQGEGALAALVTGHAVFKWGEKLMEL